MELNTFLAFWAVSILFILTPGADWAYAISAGIKGRIVVPAVAGLVFGHFLATVIVAVGVGAIISSSPMALLLITVLGALYLFWIGCSLLAAPPAPGAGEKQASASWRRWAVKGFLVSGMNPKVLLLIFALLPQFIVPSSPWPAASQIMALGVVHLVSCGAVYLLVGFAAQAILKTRPRAAQLISRVSGALMIVIAVILFAEQLGAYVELPF